jgi:hypothetical protein
MNRSTDCINVMDPFIYHFFEALPKSDNAKSLYGNEQVMVYIEMS